MTTSDEIAAASFATSIAAIALSYFAIVRANKTSSAAILVTMMETFRQAWQRYFSAEPGEERQREVCELLNLFETTCALYFEGSLSGASAKLMHEYMNGVLKQFVEHPFVEKEIGCLLQDASTYEHIKRFLRERKTKLLSITVPDKWYQTGQIS